MLCLSYHTPKEKGGEIKYISISIILDLLDNGGIQASPTSPAQFIFQLQIRDA